MPELVASYTYDYWGNILSATGSLAQLNPFRYRGCKMFAYCGNNPVVFSDANGITSSLAYELYQ